MRWKEACYGGNGCDGKVLRCGAGDINSVGGKVDCKGRREGGMAGWVGDPGSPTRQGRDDAQLLC
jgi:hypothetical protein